VSRVVALLGCLSAIAGAPVTGHGSQRGVDLAPGGTTTVRGIVIDGATDRPIGGALVTLASGEAARTTLSDRTGAFTFRHVPAGRFSIRPQKVGFVRPRWAPGQPPRLLAVKPPASPLDIRVVLVPGAVLTGSVSDSIRGPIGDATVTLLECHQFGPCEVENSIASRRVTTDDRGHYRFGGLESGRYLLVATAAFVETGAQVVGLSKATLQWAAQQMRGHTAGLRPPSEPDRPIELAPTYFPGTTMPEDAGVIDVSDSEIQADLDITLRIGESTVIRGSVLDNDGTPGPAAKVSVFPANSVTEVPSSTVAPVGSDGAFQTVALKPGRYRLVAIAGGNAERQRSAEAFVDVPGTTAGDVLLTLQRPTVIRGELGLTDDALARGARITGVAVQLQRVGGFPKISLVDRVTALVSSSGQFQLIVPVAGRFMISVIAPAARDLIPLSALADGQPVLDSGVDVSPMTQRTLRIVAGLRRAALRGDIRYTDGQPAVEYALVLFPAANRLWVSPRHVLVETVGDDGSFEFRGVPPGDYYVAALGSNEPSSVDSRLLEALVAAARPVRIVDGQVTTLRLSIGKHP
jgi:hypothetical protein